MFDFDFKEIIVKQSQYLNNGNYDFKNYNIFTGFFPVLHIIYKIY